MMVKIKPERHPYAKFTSLQRHKKLRNISISSAGIRSLVERVCFLFKLKHIKPFTSLKNYLLSFSYIGQILIRYLTFKTLFHSFNIMIFNKSREVSVSFYLPVNQSDI